MTDLNAAVQKGVFDKLSDAAPPAPVLSFLEEDFTYPFVLLGEDAVTEMGAKGARLERHELTINVCTQGESKLQLRALQEWVRATLHEQPIAALNAKLSDPILLGASDSLSEDGITFIGSQRFLIFAQES